MELHAWIVLLVALTAIAARSHALVLTVQETECVWEDVEHDMDVISGNFVVLDHEVFWGGDHPGVELTVCELETLIPSFAEFFGASFEAILLFGSIFIFIRISN